MICQLFQLREANRASLFFLKKKSKITFQMKSIEHQLSIEDANLLIVCLDLKKNGKCYPICDAKTSEYKSNIVQMLESSKQTSTLCFVDPQERKELHNATLCKLV